MKTCTKCGEAKPLEEFYRHAANRSGREGRCKVCRNADRRACAKGDPVTQALRTGAAYRKRRDWIWGLKSNPCQRCGNSYHPTAMDFDHLPGFKKVFEVNGQGMMRTRTAVEAEIAKCQLLCAVCHRIVTWERKTGEAIPL